MKAKCKILGVLCFLPIITFPLAFWFFGMAKKSRIEVDDEGLSVAWAGKKRILFADITSAQIVGKYAPDLASPLSGPLVIEMKNGKKHQLPVNLAEQPIVLVQAIEKATGITILNEEALRQPVAV